MLRTNSSLLINYIAQTANLTRLAVNRRSTAQKQNMSDRDAKLDEERRDTHEDGGDDEVRDGSSCHARPSAISTLSVWGVNSQELGQSSLKK